jgi:cysteine synthase A
MEIVESVRDLIGNTPMMRINSISSNILAKCEFMNPIGSVKDRVAVNILMKALERGEINKSTTIIEATSGNTGIALASIAASLGLKMVIVMPDSMSLERQELMKFFGAELVLTSGLDGMKGAVMEANRMHKEDPNSFIASQFRNPNNPDIHRETTAEEIWKQTDGKIDVFVAGVGTGGTLSGVGEFLKSKNPKIKVVAIEPEESAVISGEEASSHGIQGIGAGFVPKNFNRNIVDEVLKIDTQSAIQMAKDLAEDEGLLVGISSGANVLGAKILSEREENCGKNIVTVLNDTGERYISTELFMGG